ncbi:hypothetical protein RMATCC62417_11952 [Rhizopus microsporus]|nr:hypothetical protein RMATCC62417_11952 [Rhizopus microsporus]
MDYFFRGTRIELVDGESASQCTKSARQSMENLFGKSTADTVHDRMIDLLLKYANNGNDIELSSNEFNRHRVSPACALAQQCKNVRTNGVIPAHIESINHQHGHHRTVVMDWIGNIGYFYMLANIDGIYFTEKISILRLPRSLNDVSSLKPTLEALFRYKHFVAQLGQESLRMLQAREDMEILCGIIDIQSETSSASAKHPIFFTP